MAECGCGKELWSGNRSGRCRSCAARHMSSDPEINARRCAALKRACNDPEHRRRTSERARAFFKGNERASQERRERGIRDYHRTIGSPAARAAANRPDVVAKRTRAMVETRMGWCPPEYRQAYLDLIRKKQIGKAEARRIILAEIAAKQPKLTSFERAMERVRNGAGISVVRPIPRRVEPSYTLGGVSSI